MLNIYSQPLNDLPVVNSIPTSAFEFIKFGELPVNEYAGLPNISIPIYTLKDGDLSLPIALSYHAGGIRVAEEASWVGLGWSLNFGNIVQIINDKDDLDPETTKVLPDYYFSPYKFEFPQYYDYPYVGPVGGNPLPVSNGIHQTNPQHSFVYFTDYYIGLNGAWNRNPNLFNAEISGSLWPNAVDSEPDIFKASFLGHSVEFMFEFENYSNEIVVFTKNYKVNRLSDGWRIITPNGVKYYFQVLDEVVSDVSNGISDGHYSYNPVQDVQSRVWHLTKIESPKNRTITLNYEETAYIKNLPSFTQKIKYFTFLSVDGYLNDVTRQVNNFTSGQPGSQSNPNYLSESFSVCKSLPFKRYYLSSIEVSDGIIEFIVSGREDIIGDVKLDQIILKNPKNTIIKQFNFSYSYFIGHNNGGSALDHPTATSFFSIKTANELNYRLKLNSFQEVGNANYSFTYNSTALPSKASYAVDYWGFYNGITTNSSLISNPTHLGIENMQCNGNDRRAYLQSTKAGVLEEIKYPTGGKTVFDYELHTFLNSEGVGNTTGSGLRIKEMIDYTDNKVAKMTRYSYENGKSIVPLKNYAKNIGYSHFHLNTSCNSSHHFYNYFFNIISGHNFYTSSNLGSGNFIGYSKVTKENIDRFGNNNGSIITHYSNNPDIFAHDVLLDMALPPRKNTAFQENGVLLSSLVLNKNGDTLRHTINEYYPKQLSTIRYGAKTAAQGIKYWKTIILGDVHCSWKSQDLIGFYPIYTVTSLLKSSTVKEYLNDGIFEVKEEYAYTPNNLLRSITKNNSNGDAVVSTYFYPQDKAGTLMTLLVNANRLNDPVETFINNNGRLQVERKDFANYNGNIWLNSISESKDGAAENFYYTINNIVYDNKGNPTYYRTIDGLSYSNIFDNYNQQIAKITNCIIDKAYTSFEFNSDKGGWYYNENGNLNAYDNLTSRSGNSSYIIYNGGSISKYIAPGTYELSYWIKGGSISINGCTIEDIESSSGSNGWVRHRKKIIIAESTPQAVQIHCGNGGPNVRIDDLRLHYVDAQMTSYTHDPLVGVTSITDPNGRTIFYEYDELGRLKTVRDEDGNILEHHEYNYYQE